MNFRNNKIIHFVATITVSSFIITQIGLGTAFALRQEAVVEAGVDANGIGAAIKKAGEEVARRASDLMAGRSTKNGAVIERVNVQEALKMANGFSKNGDNEFYFGKPLFQVVKTNELPRAAVADLRILIGQVSTGEEKPTAKSKVKKVFVVTKANRMSIVASKDERDAIVNASAVGEEIEIGAFEPFQAEELVVKLVPRRIKDVKALLLKLGIIDKVKLNDLTERLRRVNKIIIQPSTMTENHSREIEVKDHAIVSVDNFNNYLGLGYRINRGIVLKIEITIKDQTVYMQPVLAKAVGVAEPDVDSVIDVLQEISALAAQDGRKLQSVWLNSNGEYTYFFEGVVSSATFTQASVPNSIRDVLKTVQMENIRIVPDLLSEKSIESFRRALLEIDSMISNLAGLGLTNPQNNVERYGVALFRGIIDPAKNRITSATLQPAVANGTGEVEKLLLNFKGAERGIFIDSGLKEEWTLLSGKINNQYCVFNDAAGKKISHVTVTFNSDSGILTVDTARSILSGVEANLLKEIIARIAIQSARSLQAMPKFLVIKHNTVSAYDDLKKGSPLSNILSELGFAQRLEAEGLTGSGNYWAIDFNQFMQACADRFVEKAAAKTTSIGINEAQAMVMQWLSMPSTQSIIFSTPAGDETISVSEIGRNNIEAISRKIQDVSFDFMPPGAGVYIALLNDVIYVVSSKDLIPSIAQPTGLSREKLLQYWLRTEMISFIDNNNRLINNMVITEVGEETFSFQSQPVSAIEQGKITSLMAEHRKVPFTAYKYVGPQTEAEAAQKVLTGVALVIGPSIAVRPFGCDFNEVVVVPEDADIIAEIEKIKGEGKTIVVVINNTGKVLTLTEAGPLNIVTITDPDRATEEVEQSI